VNENYKKSKSSWTRWVVAGGWGVVVLVVLCALPGFVRGRDTRATNACINNLRLIDEAKQQWALENNKGDADTDVTWDDLKRYLGRGATGSLNSIHCQGDKTQQYSNSYTIGDLKTKPKCKINPAHSID
jgi:hypothetical protein